jgi:endonuclease/exonuclease/phosphatase family metal-dependent hydrolase
MTMNAPNTQAWRNDSRPRLRIVVLEIRPDPDPPEALGRELRRLNPDFCLVQNIAVPLAEPWLKALAAPTGAHVISGPNLVLRNGIAGLALLTRWPPLTKRFADLSLPPAPANGAMDLEFEIDGNTIRIVAAQLSSRPDEHAIQTAHLHTMLARRPRPALVLGRFSASDLRPAASWRTGGRRASASWSSRLGLARQDGRVRIGTFPPCPLDAAPFIPPTPAMIGFEVSAPAGSLAAALCPAGMDWASD